MHDGDAGTRLERAGTGEHAPRRRLESRAGAGSVSRAALQRDASVRQWGVVTPSATVIGRAESPEAELSDRVRRLHDEQHGATPGYAERAHRLDRLRTTQALCNALEVTPWQRDLALGVMDEIDLTAFGSQRAIPTVALVVIRHVVDRDRQAYFGLDDVDAASLSPDRMEELFGQYRAHDITDEPTFERLAAEHGLDTTSLNRLRRVLEEQLEDELPAYGRNPWRDPNLPATTGTDSAEPSESTGSEDTAEPGDAVGTSESDADDS
ncbi:DNA-directed RNA polymerase subunit epsilon [Halostagnicola kamekurae]|uniref:DNA-directed RNA polymerase subunit epsilon n=1 Tax=Halostagnicola kamekurae TaxID=619731 RepID=A0A1I6RLR0_9EURY|nr:DNA-directed RNA polymerase subunit epsilon [Halostagnicola kamekurae]SFS65683.1 hypothetical protein SAMN04488556_1892 [Halostagnicola kamekurae]